MKKSDVKNRIIQTFIQKVNEKGYAETNINKVAYEAKVSIGTLYYHFKKGKLSLLLAIINDLIKNHGERLHEFGFSNEMEFVDFHNGLKSYLTAFLSMHKPHRCFLAAFEAEILSKIDYYIKLGEQYNASEMTTEGANTFSCPINHLIERFNEKTFSTRGKEVKIFLVADTLTHQQVYNNKFGSDGEFLDLLTDVLIALLKLSH